MEILIGGLSNRDCMIRGFGLTAGIVGGFFFPPLLGAAFGIAATSGDCYH
jgi:hypothetical protein